MVDSLEQFLRFVLMYQPVDVHHIKYYKFIDRVLKNWLKLTIQISINRIGYS